MWLFLLGLCSILAGITKGLISENFWIKVLLNSHKSMHRFRFSNHQVFKDNNKTKPNKSRNAKGTNQYYTVNTFICIATYCL